MGDGLKRVHEAKNLAFLLCQLLFLVAVLHHHVESMCNRAPLLLGGWVRVRDQRSGRPYAVAPVCVCVCARARAADYNCGDISYGDISSVPQHWACDTEWH